MNIAIVILGYLLAAYFFAAAFIPRSRFRWGYGRSWTWSRSGKTKGRYRESQMGTLSCLGIGLFIAALATFFVAPASAIKAIAPFTLIGGILAIIGKITDTGGNGTGRWKKY